jgi:hypothetical protein
MAVIETPSYTVLCIYCVLVDAIFSSSLYYLLYCIFEYVTLYHCEPLHGQYCKFLNFRPLVGFTVSYLCATSQPTILLPEDI